MELNCRLTNRCITMHWCSFTTLIVLQCQFVALHYTNSEPQWETQQDICFKISDPRFIKTQTHPSLVTVTLHHFWGAYCVCLTAWPVLLRNRQESKPEMKAVVGVWAGWLCVCVCVRLVPSSGSSIQALISSYHPSLNRGSQAFSKHTTLCVE